jgi:hypothetical protein
MRSNDPLWSTKRREINDADIARTLAMVGLDPAEDHDVRQLMEIARAHDVALLVTFMPWSKAVRMPGQVPLEDVVPGLPLAVGGASPYELMELQTGNVIGEYATEEAALRDVADTIHRGGPAAVATLALGCLQHGRTAVIAKGAALARRATQEGGAVMNVAVAPPGGALL